jgi:hypothetical protein
MHGVNLDLLQTTRHHANGTPKDPHAQHRAEHLANLRAARRDIWRNRLARWRKALSVRTVPQAQPCTDQPL